MVKNTTLGFTRNDGKKITFASLIREPFVASIREWWGTTDEELSFEVKSKTTITDYDKADGYSESVFISVRDKDGKQHSVNDMPSEIFIVKDKSKYDCSAYWHERGRQNRADDKPSFIRYDESKLTAEKWYVDGSKGRLNDMPAVIEYDQGKVISEKYFKNYEKHREGDKPAVVTYDIRGRIICETYYKNDEIYREGDKPAEVNYRLGEVASESWFKDGKFVKSVDKGYSFRIDILEPREDGETFEVLDSCYFTAPNAEAAEKRMITIVKVNAEKWNPKNYRSLTYDLMQADAVYKGDELYEADFDGVTSLSFEEVDEEALEGLKASQAKLTMA